ncbi:MAG TPA: tRNA (adenosine(37)-N6)-threonylcarbamoyltransferase complex dimerization subunit type 1 TsaB, partial [Coriobacteriia bacterium]|nr:tRNA (adenosine(37)-N6)-threonylcarbamoyltransferase complex dimerization subunit type 1 TsaB [Coriobacteriia bacterium]
MSTAAGHLVLAFDTATDALAVGIGQRAEGELAALRSLSIVNPRKANSTLLPTISSELDELGYSVDQVCEVVVGRGPGSFTGVRIGVATAKGLAQGLGVGLYGVSTLDAVAWRVLATGDVAEGDLLGVLGDAMRGEVYPALYRVIAGRAVRLTEDRVAKPQEVAAEWAAGLDEPLLLVGNALKKYEDVFVGSLGARQSVAEEGLWSPDGAGLLAAYEDAHSSGTLGDGEPALVLPVYTRLSDAEETERLRLGTGAELPPTGVAGGASAFVHTRPMTPEDIPEIVAIEEATFSDPWSTGIFMSELSAPRRAWVVLEESGIVIGYGGVAALGDDAHVMNLAVESAHRGRGLGRLLLRRLKDLALDLGTKLVTLEVRETNEAAISLYESEGLSIAGVRRRYYSDTGEDALIMWGPAGGDDSATPSPESRYGECAANDSLAARGTEDTLILAIESSCDETAAAVMRGTDGLVANVVASQIDFHARFGGVVPEIASRKHTEAIVGVIEEALDRAGDRLGCEGALPFRELDAIAVTHGPGLVGALVVGLAYAKGLSFATGVPLVGVNHLEGHIFANVLADPEVRPPLVALLVSGGHTSLVHMPRWGEYHTLGETLDDAAGEAFDKVAKVLGLGYPGGPVLSRLAEEGNAEAIDFPRAM